MNRAPASSRRPGLVAAARAAAASTPEGRDRVVDLLRAGSLLTVVLGHGLMAVVVWHAGVPRVENLLARLPALQLLTWLLQVMPVFFAAGQLANEVSRRSSRAAGTPWRCWYWARIRRLVRPVVYYLAAWIPLTLLLAALDPRAAVPLARLSTQLLWFLGVYVVVVALTDPIARLGRLGWPAVAGLLTVVAVTDLARFHLVAGVGALNFVTVWVLAATLGPIMRARAGRIGLVGVAAGAVGVNLALTHWGPYPFSMVGLPGEKISNMAPPTLVLALHAVVLCCVIGYLWPRLARACERARVWVATCLLGGVAMSVYLWHLTALILVVLVQHALGLDRPDPHVVWFWPATLGYLAAFVATTAGLVRIVAPLEYLPVPWLEPGPTAAPARWRTVLAVGSVPALAIGFLTLALTGMGGFPFRETSYLGIGWSPALTLGLLGVAVLVCRTGGATPPARDDPVSA